MFSVNFFFLNYLFILIYVYLEVFINLIYFSIFKHIKTTTITLAKKLTYFLFHNNLFSVLINFNIFYLLTLKTTFINTQIISFILIYLFIYKLLNTYVNYNIAFINYNIIIFIFMFLYIKTLIAFFLLMELYSIIFYFFFLNNTPKQSTLTLLQYKNMLLLYLLNNFFISIFFLIGINSIIELWGTSNFMELSILNTHTYPWTNYFIIIGFLFKLALPGFHFFKLEIYKYLSMDVVVVYSVITIFINYWLVLYLLNFNFIYNLLESYKILNIVCIGVLFFFIHKLKVNVFGEFIAYSGFATNNLILLNFLI